MATLARSRVRQMDFVEWFTANRATVKALTAERWAMEKGVVDYLRDGVGFVQEMRTAKKERNEKKEAAAKAPKEAKPETVVLSALDQYYVSQELLKRMKWKRITWDNDADYDSFNRRILDNDSLFTKVPAMSFMTLHLVRDPAAPALPPPTPDARQITSIKEGVLTNWFLQAQRPPMDSPLRQPLVSKAKEPLPASRAPVAVDWESGTVRVLDSITAQEMLNYLETTAGRVQALQQRMEDEQTKLTEDIDSVRIRLGVTAVKFNQHDKSFWDDTARKQDADNYVTPAELRQFIDAVFKRGFLLRRYVKGNQIRVVPAGKPYAIDKDAKEIRIPANFAEFNFLAMHRRWESIERIANACRATYMLWFFIGMMIVGDFELV